MCIRDSVNARLVIRSIIRKCFKCIRFSATQPVSYTHLDVYKRQVSGTGSFTSDETANNGREFRQASTCDKTVVNSSKVGMDLPTTRRKWYFKLFILLSQRPPKWGDEGGINDHLIPWEVAKYWIDEVASFYARDCKLHAKSCGPS